MLYASFQVVAAEAFIFRADQTLSSHQKSSPPTAVHFSGIGVHR
jgi:hypothetical protein